MTCIFSPTTYQPAAPGPCLSDWDAVRKCVGLTPCGPEVPAAACIVHLSAKSRGMLEVLRRASKRTRPEEEEEEEEEAVWDEGVSSGVSYVLPAQQAEAQDQVSSSLRPCCKCTRRDSGLFLTPATIFLHRLRTAADSSSSSRLSPTEMLTQLRFAASSRRGLSQA